MPMTDAKWGGCRRNPHTLFRSGAPALPSSWCMAEISGRDEAASSAIVWNRNFDALARHFHVVAFDKLGQGHTDNPRERRLHDERRGPATPMPSSRTLGLSDVHLAGHSRGGYLGLPRDAGAARSGRVLHDYRQQHLLARARPQRHRACRRAPGPGSAASARNGSTEHYSYSPHHIDDAFLDAAVEVANLPQVSGNPSGRWKMRDSGPRMFLPGAGKGQVGDVRLDP